MKRNRTNIENLYGSLTLLRCKKVRKCCTNETVNLNPIISSFLYLTVYLSQYTYVKTIFCVNIYAALYHILALIKRNINTRFSPDFRQFSSRKYKREQALLSKRVKSNVCYIPRTGFCINEFC